MNATELKVKVMELITKDGGRVLLKGQGLEGQGLDLKEHEGYPLPYMWHKMVTEKSRFFLLEWDGRNISQEPSQFIFIPQRTRIGDFQVSLSHRNTIYTDQNLVIGHYEKLTEGDDHRVLVRYLW